MSDELLTSIERFEELLRRDRRYQPEAYNFVYEALDWTLQHLVEGPVSADSHVDGRQLLEGIRQYAIRQFGPLASTVFENWGVKKTDDWGEIVFNLIEYDLMGRSENDNKEDFCQVYDFQEVFNLEPAFDYDPATDTWRVSYRPAGTAYQKSGL